jgi:hypothetical protein
MRWISSVSPPFIRRDRQWESVSKPREGKGYSRNSNCIGWRIAEQSANPYKSESRFRLGRYEHGFAKLSARLIQHVCFLNDLVVIQSIAMKKTDPIRQHISNLLTKAEAHIDLREALKDFPKDLRGSKPEGGPHTPWQLLEHTRIAQWDILEFSRSAKHKSPKWPEEYWPKTEAPPDDKAWDKSVNQVLADLEAMRELVADPQRDLTAKIPHGGAQTLLREALLVADHNAYHLGQLVMVRRILERK